MALFGKIGKVIGLPSLSSLASSPLTGSLITGGASLLGGYLANRSSAQSTRDQMDFQAEQSSTSYQRAMADMRAAGLNPMLAYSQGGASTPNGASYDAQNIVEPAVNSARSTMRLQEELKNMRAANAVSITQAALNQANTRKVNAETASLDPERKIRGVVGEGTHQMLNKVATQGNVILDSINSIIDGIPSFARQKWNQFKNHVHDLKEQAERERSVTVIPRGRSSANSILLPPPVDYK